jgi:hypothetical protein
MDIVIEFFGCCDIKLTTFNAKSQLKLLGYFWHEYTVGQNIAAPLLWLLEALRENQG